MAVELLEQALAAVEERVERGLVAGEVPRTNASNAAASPSSARQKLPTCSMPRSIAGPLRLAVLRHQLWGELSLGRGEPCRAHGWAAVPPVSSAIERAIGADTMATPVKRTSASRATRNGQRGRPGSATGCRDMIPPLRRCGKPGAQAVPTLAGRARPQPSGAGPEGAVILGARMARPARAPDGRAAIAQCRSLARQEDRCKAGFAMAVRECG